MDTERFLHIAAMSLENARGITRRRYDGIYSFYSHDGESPDPAWTERIMRARMKLTT